MRLTKSYCEGIGKTHFLTFWVMFCPSPSAPTALPQRSHGASTALPERSQSDPTDCRALEWPGNAKFDVFRALKWPADAKFDINGLADCRLFCFRLRIFFKRTCVCLCIHCEKHVLGGFREIPDGHAYELPRTSKNQRGVYTFFFEF